MENQKSKAEALDQRPRYIWPWFVLGAFLLAIVLAIIWMRHEVERTRQIRDLNAPPPKTGERAAAPD